MLPDLAEDREKQAFSFPSEYCQGGAGGADIVKPALGLLEG